MELWEMLIWKRGVLMNEGGLRLFLDVNSFICVIVLSVFWKLLENIWN